MELKTFRIFALCVVKNEDDVLEECITAAARWADGIFIADNESDDETPEIIRRLVSKFDNVLDAGAIAGPFTDDMRGAMFNRVGHVSRPGDWWCKLDADEFFIDDPREFLAAMPGETDTVWGSFYTFYFTELALERYRRDPRAFLATPVVNRLKYLQKQRVRDPIRQACPSLDLEARVAEVSVCRVSGPDSHRAL